MFHYLFFIALLNVNMASEIDAIEKNQTWYLVDKTFSPVVRMDIIKDVLAIVAQNQWHVYQMEVKSTFLSGILAEKVYVG